MVAVPDRPGALAAAAGVLALHSLEVHAAELTTAERASRCSPSPSRPRFGGLPDPALLRSDLVRVLDGSLTLSEALARKERDYAPIAVRRRATRHRRGCCGSTTRPPGRWCWSCVAPTGSGCCTGWPPRWRSCGVDLRWARVATLGSSVVDSFGLAGAADVGQLGPTARRRIEQAMLAAAR